MIREFLENNAAGFATDVGDYKASLNITEADHTNVDAVAPDSIMVEIEGIHAAPFSTRNYTRYTPKCLRDSVNSWTQPYRRPLIKHHNEENGEPIGRIVSAEYTTRNTRSGTPALKFTVNVPDEKAKESIQNGLLSTVSIGVIAHDIRCSICGKPILDAERGCENGHKRGVTYTLDSGEKATCYWDIHEMEAKELSYVDVPSDMYAKTIDIYPAEKHSSNQSSIKESLDSSNIIPEEGEQNMAEQQNELEKTVSELKAKISELTEAKKASDDKATELAETKDKLEKQVAELTEAKKALETSIEESKQLKETMEAEIADTKAKLKESMADTYATLREALGSKVKDIENIKARSVDSLQDSIIDMKESLAAKQAVDVKESAEEKAPETKKVDLKEAAGSVKDPSVKGTADSKEVERVDLKAGLASIFSSVMSAR